MLPLAIDSASIIGMAETAISRSLAALAASYTPKADNVLAEITFAYKLNLIDYAHRELLMAQAKSIASNRMQELQQAKNGEALKIVCRSCNGSKVFANHPCHACTLTEA